MIRHLVLGGTRGLAIAATCWAVLGAGCSASPAPGSSDAMGREGPSPTIADAPSAAATTPSVSSDWRHWEQVLEVGLPRSTTFAGVDFELTAAMVSWQTPESYEDGGPPEPSDVPHAYLELRAHNRTTRIEMRIPDDEFRLLTPDGEEIALEHGGFGPLAPDSTTDGFLAFAVEEAFVLKDAILVIGGGPDTPALLPLSGEVPAAGYPIELATTGRVEGPGQLWGAPVTFELLGGVISKDLAVEACCPDTGPRADQEEVFLTLRLRVTGPNDLYGEQVGSRSVRLLVDGVTREPWHAPLVTSKGAAVDVAVAFVVPTTAREVILLLGDSSEGEPGAIELPLPELPASPATGRER